MKNITEFRSKPDHSIIDKNIDGNIHYVDSYCAAFDNKMEYSVDYLTALFFSSVPGWVRMLLKLRDTLVAPFGLEVGMIPERETIDASVRYDIGGRAIYFSVIERTESEIVMAEDDKHLYFRTSVFIDRTSDRGRSNIYITTIVKFHNFWGRLYFLPVKPFHKLIVKTLLKNLCEGLKQGGAAADIGGNAV